VIFQRLSHELSSAPGLELGPLDGSYKTRELNPTTFYHCDFHLIIRRSHNHFDILKISQVHVIYSALPTFIPTSIASTIELYPYMTRIYHMSLAAGCQDRHLLLEAWRPGSSMGHHARRRAAKHLHHSHEPPNTAQSPDSAIPLRVLPLPWHNLPAARVRMSDVILT